MFSANRSSGKSRLPSLDLGRHRSSSVGYASRDSYGVPKRASSEERKSGNGTNRRWSGMRNSLNANEIKGIGKDTRPLTDKNYQKKKVGEILEFLSSVDFYPVMTQTKLMQPSKKDFELMFEFLVKFWEPSFKLKSIEEDGPKMLKTIGYPFIPKNSVFQHVARTSFTAILGILIYLVDLARLKVDDEYRDLLKNGVSQYPEEHAAFLHYIFESYTSEPDEEELKEICDKLILSRYGDDFSKVEEENVENKEKLKEVIDQVEKLEQLQKEIGLMEIRINQYEEYFLNMQKCMVRKEVSISQLSDELKNLKLILGGFEEELSKKRAIYDAQGFDGKRHLSYFENQKKELDEAMKIQKSLLKECETDCYEMELQQTKILGKGEELCKNIHQMYIKIEDAGKTVSDILQNIKDSDVQKMLNSFNVAVPKAEVKFNHTSISVWITAHKQALEEYLKTIGKAKLVLKTIISTKSEELTEMEMKKLKITTNLKCTSADEAKRNQNFINFDKQTVDEIKSLEKKCNEEFELLKKLQKENSEKEAIVKHLKSDLQTVEQLKLNKASMLDNYLKHWKQYHNQQISLLNMISSETEEMGEEIVSALKETLKKK